jgi:hypothetical protein
MLPESNIRWFHCPIGGLTKRTPGIGDFRLYCSYNAILEAVHARHGTPRVAQSKGDNSQWFEES